MGASVDEIMRLASVLATRRVRAFAVLQKNYRGNESPERIAAQVAEATAALRAAVEALAKDSANAAFDSVAKSFGRQP